MNHQSINRAVIFPLFHASTGGILYVCLYVCTCSLYFLLSLKKKVQLKTDITSRISYTYKLTTTLFHTSSGESYYIYHTSLPCMYIPLYIYIIYLHPFIHLFVYYLRYSSPLRLRSNSFTTA